MIWANQIVQGVLLGGYYAVLATGLALLFGVMRIINLAHGALAVLAAFALWDLHDRTGWSVFACLLLVVPGMFVVGVVLQRGLLERSLRSGTLVPLLSTFGLAVVIENLLFEHYGADTRSLDIGDLAFNSWKVTDEIYVSQLAALILAVAVLLLVALQVVLSWTPLGRAIRATAQDADVAELVGVNSRAVYAVSAGIAIATVAIAGAFLGMRATFDPYAGPNQLIYAFEAVVIGGIGSLWGTLLGGIALGVAQSVGAQLDPQWPLLTGHLVFLAVLAARLVYGAVRDRGLRGALGFAS